MVPSTAHGTHSVQYRPTWNAEIVFACNSFPVHLDEVVSHRDGFRTVETKEKGRRHPLRDRPFRVAVGTLALLQSVLPLHLVHVATLQ
jgi:hypothetical protein